MGSELIKVQAIDNDVGNNSLVQYHIVTIRYFQSQSNGSEDMGNIFTIGELPGLLGSGCFKVFLDSSLIKIFVSILNKLRKAVF